MGLNGALRKKELQGKGQALQNKAASLGRMDLKHVLRRDCFISTFGLQRFMFVYFLV